MELIVQLLHIFFKEFNVIQLIETEESFSFEVSSSNVSVPASDNLEKNLAFLKSRDHLTLDFKIGEMDPISLYSKTKNITLFLEELSNKIQYKEEDDCIIKIEIHKSNENGYLSLYSLEAFSEYLDKLPFEEILSSLSDAFNKNSFLVLDSIEALKTYQSDTIFIGNSIKLSAEKINEINNLKRSKRELLNNVCHYGNSQEFSFIPDDFNFNKVEGFEKIGILFDRLKLIFSLISICDITYNTDNGIYYKLNGFKSISGEAFYYNLKLSSLDEYYKIYQWIYEGGNLNDKIGLARNIISIHCDNANIVELKEGAYNSIRSGFEVYLKQNIKQYIEVRNKVSDQLVDFSNKANQIADGFAANFQKSIFAFFSFFASVIIIRVLSKGEYTKILSNEAAILSVAFLLVVGVFLIFSRWEIKKQRERFVNNYLNLKDRFKDLLVDGDIERILNNDKGHNKDLEFIDEKIKKYTQLWLITLAIFFVCIIILSIMYNDVPIGKILGWLSCCRG